MKIDIFSGFLGSGKTTLIKKLIKEAYSNEKLVLIENEFGEIGIDGGFMKDAGIEITEMNSGCICCSLVGDFSKALKQVYEQFSPDRIIIEPSGVGKLSDVAKAVMGTDLPNAVVNACTTVVNAKKCKMYMKNFGEFFNDQVANAGCIILSHVEDIEEEKLNETVALLRVYNKTAEIVTTPISTISGDKILSAMERTQTLKSELEKLEKEARNSRSHDHEHHHDDSCSCGSHDHDHHHDDSCSCGCHDHEHHHDDSCSCGCHDHEHHHDDSCSCGSHDHEHHHDDSCSCGCHDHEHHHDDSCSCGCHDHEHHHDDSCSCGCHDHDHHHDDSCSCGSHDHEHHHDDSCSCGCHDHDHHHDDSCSCGCHDHDHHHAEEIFASWGKETTKKFTKEEVLEMLEKLDSCEIYGVILRAKGIVSGDEGWIHFDYIPGGIDVRSGTAETTGRLCVIGSKINEQALAELFGI